MRQLQLPKRHVLERSPWFSDYVLLDDAEEVRVCARTQLPIRRPCAASPPPPLPP